MALERSAEVVLKEIADRYAELADLDLAALTEGEIDAAAIEAQRARSMADHACLRTAAALEASQAWVAEGARSAAAHLAWKARIPRARAKATVAGGRDLVGMPKVSAALAAGEITTDHVRILAAAARTNPEMFAADGESRLLEAARTLLFEGFRVAARYWCDRADPDGAEQKARRRWLGRRAHCSTTFEGEVAIDAHLEAVGGSIVRRELERLERELFELDLAEARARLGRDDVSWLELARTPAQRRADALVLMAERSAAKPAGALEPRILLHVLCGEDSLGRMCELSDGTVLTPGEVLPLLDRAEVERAVFDGPSKVIDLGPRRRLFTGATRTAVQLRDRGCVHPSCDVPFDRCEVDHVLEYSRGGLTVQDNGRCLCKHHHRRARPG
jgi:hypothetical protein